MSSKKNNKNSMEVTVMENTNEVTLNTVKEKRTRKSFEEAKAARLADMDVKIASAERYLEELKAKRQEIADRQPKQRAKSAKTQANELVAGLMAQGKSIDEIKALLGV